MATNKVQMDAARRYAKSHGMTIHQAMESDNFQYAWNKFASNPGNKTYRGALGIRRRNLTKEAKHEEAMFC